MGFFSKCCAKSHLPVVTIHRTGAPPALTEVVALTPRGKIVEGFYDGYGRVGGESLYEDYDDWRKIKFVLKMHYAGEKYEDLPKSYDERGQGYFMDQRFLTYCMLVRSFKSRAEYMKAFKKYAGWI